MIKKSNSKKNILIFFWYYSPPGGAEVFVEQITKRLSSDYNFELITAKCKKNLLNEEKINQVLVHRVGIGNFIFDKFFFPLFSIQKACKIKKDKKISLIHGVIANPAGLSAMIFHRLTKIPLLITEQSGNLDQAVRKLTPATFWAYKKIYQNSNFIHVISNFLKETILALGIDEKRVEIIPNGINLSEFKSSGQKKEQNRIICVGRLEKYKGIRYLIEALPKILESFPKTRLILVGEGSERENLKTQISRLGLENKVLFMGDIPHKEIPGELAKSSVSVLASLEEGQGLAVLEAQAAQIPVIGTNIGGIPDFIKDGETGILVKPADSKGIVKSILEVFSKPEFAQKLVENARANLKEYDWDNVAKKIDKIYQKLLL